jgi:23S rRNA (adenine-N6)-dimethyltransferase
MSPRRSSRPTRPLLGGPHELGQNWLVDRRFPAEMAEILRHAPPLPIVELAAGNGAVTEVLLELDLPVTAVEIDPGRVDRLRRRFATTRAEIVEADMLTYAFGSTPHHVVANVPFSVTTPFLRRLLRQPHWNTAVLLLQWEVARKRAGVGGTTLLTASWWPWFAFELASRVPARAFAPVPTVDGGILVTRRRHDPPIRLEERPAYQEMVRQVFTGRGRGLPAILHRRLPERDVRRWMIQQHLGGQTLPRDLKAEDWVSLFRVSTTDSTRGGRRTPPGRRLPPPR